MWTRIIAETVLCGALGGAAGALFKNAKVGTKSLLVGYHQFLLHPLFVWAGWIRLHGWTWDPRVILALFAHDIGYFGKPNMDGPEGSSHPFLGAKILHLLFDGGNSAEWYLFSLYHSREMCRTYIGEESKLCWADKQAFLFYPKWLLKALYWASGEGKEYLARSRNEKGEWLPPMKWDEWHHQMILANVRTLAKAGYKA